MYHLLDGFIVRLLSIANANNRADEPSGYQIIAINGAQFHARTRFFALLRRGVIFVVGQNCLFFPALSEEKHFRYFS